MMAMVDMNDMKQKLQQAAKAGWESFKASWRVRAIVFSVALLAVVLFCFLFMPGKSEPKVAGGDLTADSREYAAGQKKGDADAKAGRRNTETETYADKASEDRDPFDMAHPTRKEAGLVRTIDKDGPRANLKGRNGYIKGQEKLRPGTVTAAAEKPVQPPAVSTVKPAPVKKQSICCKGIIYNEGRQMALVQIGEKSCLLGAGDSKEGVSLQAIGAKGISLIYQGQNHWLEIGQTV